MSRLPLAPLLLALAALGGCRAAEPSLQPAPAEPDSIGAIGAIGAIRATLTELYEAFCFDPHGEPDWAAQRRLFAAGAGFVAPFAPGETPRSVGADEFLADFRAFVRRPPLSETGFHERIAHAEIDTFGTIAHAYVVFEGFAPGQPTSRRGLDSIQLVLDGERWLIASFTTQYETPDAPLPLRFLH